MELLEAETLAPFLPKRDPEGHKGSYGHVLVLAGSKGKTGAAAMTCLGALRAGAGLVTLGIPESLNPIMEIKLTEAMTEPLPEGEPGSLGPAALSKIINPCVKGKRPWLLVPVFPPHRGQQALVQALLKQIKDIPMVIDADGLNALADASGRIEDPGRPGHFNSPSGRNVPINRTIG